MKILTVVGARPEFVKLAPLDQELRRVGVEHIVVHTGQHYDRDMSGSFFADLGIEPPTVRLSPDTGSHGRQTGSILAGMDRVIGEFEPNWVVVFGDTNSTLAGALSAVKLHVPLAHVEAGLRSFNRLMPEEHNRVLTDHAADLCLAPTLVAMQHLEREGLADRSLLVGDINVDVLNATVRRLDVEATNLPEEAVVSESYYVATIHRQENVDDPERLRAIVAALQNAPSMVLLAVHPRLKMKAEAIGLELSRGAVRAVGPMAFPALVAAMRASVGVITDSGGLQKEAFLLRVPCTTLRTETEWTETVDLGWNILVPEPAYLDEALRRPSALETDAEPYGDGRTASRIVSALLEK